jgi:RNase adaptor protein for sRNA GlmZ degradation
MKEHEGILQDVIDTAQPKEESKTKKYIRIAIGCVGLGFIVLTFIMVFLRKYGG